MRPTGSPGLDAAGPGRRASRRGPTRARGGSCRRSVAIRIIGSASARARARRRPRPTSTPKWRSTFARPLDREPVDRRRDVAAAAELGRDDDLPLPLGLADEQARCRRCRCRRSTSRCSRRASPSDHLPPLLGVVDPVHLRPGQEEARAAAAVHVDDDVGARGTGTVERKCASCSSGVPSGEPGNERFMFAPEGHRRVYGTRGLHRHARDHDHAGRATCSGWSSRARLSAATWPSGSSPWTPPSTSAVGPSPPAHGRRSGRRSSHPRVFDERGSLQRADTASRAPRGRSCRDRRVAHGRARHPRGLLTISL